MINSTIINNYLNDPHDLCLFTCVISYTSLTTLLNSKSMIDSFIINQYLNIIRYNILAHGNKNLIMRCHFFTGILTGNSDLAEDYRVPISLTQTIISNFKLFCQTFKLIIKIDLSRENLV